MLRNPFFLLGLVLSVFVPSLNAEPAIKNHSAEINIGTANESLDAAEVLNWSGDARLHRGDNDYGNGGWAFALEGDQVATQQTDLAVELGAAYAIRFDTALFATGLAPIIGGSVRNGDFGADTSTTDKRNFDVTPFWTNYRGNETVEATRTNLDINGTRNAILYASGFSAHAQDTGYDLTAGEVLEVSFAWRDAYQWSDSQDRVGVTLFYTNDNSIGGSMTVIEQLLAPASTIDSTYETFEGSFAPIPAAADGRRLFVIVEAVDGNSDSTGWSRLDNFVLAPAGAAAGGGSSEAFVAELYVMDGGNQTIVATREFSIDQALEGQWNHEQGIVLGGDLDSYAGQALGIQFRGQSISESSRVLIDNIRLEEITLAETNASFADDWNATPNQPWPGPGYWGNRTQDWEVRSQRVNCLEGGADRRTLIRTGNSVLPNGGTFNLSVRTGRYQGSTNNGDRTGFLVGAGPSLDWRASLLVHDGLGRDFGLFCGVRGDGRPVIDDLSTGSVTEIAAGSTPSGGFPSELRLDLSAVYNAVQNTYTLTLRTYNSGGTLLGSASTIVPSHRLMGAFGLLSHGGSNARFWFDDFMGSGTALKSEPGRDLAFIGAMHTLSQGTLKITAQLPPVSLSPVPSVMLERYVNGAWESLGTESVDTTDGVSSYTATFKASNWPDMEDVPYRLSYETEGDRYYWEGTIRKDPIGKDDLVIAATTCQRLSDQATTGDGIDWTPVDIWHPHNLAFDHIAKHDPDILAALGDQIYEGLPAWIDARSDFHRHHDYLYKWYLWVLQVRNLIGDVPTVAIPDDHDVYQGNIWGEGGIPTAVDNEGGYTQPATWVKMVERTQTSNLPDPDPYNPVQPAPPVAQGIGVYFTKFVYGGLGIAVIEDRKFKTGWQNPPSPSEQQLLGERQHAFLTAFAEDWDDQCLKLVFSQSPFGNLHTHSSTGYGFNINIKDTNGWPLHRRNEAWELLRKGRMFQIAGDTHLSTVVHHGIDSPADAGYSFVAPAISNFWPRVFDPVHNAAGTTSAVSPYKGDFYFDGQGTLPSGQPNLNAQDPAHIRFLAAGNPLQYYQQTRGIDPANLHDRGAGYGIIRINKPDRVITFESWPLHADPEFPQTGGPFADWPITLQQSDNDGRTPTGYLPDVVTGRQMQSVLRVYDESNDELVYAIRLRGNRYRPAVYDNGTTYRLEIDHLDGSSEVLEGQAVLDPSAPAIQSFQALQPSISLGSSAVLQWAVTSPSTLTIDSGIGDVLLFTVDGIGFHEVTPTNNTTYTLTLNGTETSQTTVKVFPTKQAWIDGYFSPQEQLDGLADDGSNPDGDDSNNAIEYNFQMNPRAFDADLLFSSKVESSGDELIVDFDVSVPLDANETDLLIESSENLEAWALVDEDQYEIVGRSNLADGTSRLLVRWLVPTDSLSKLFFRAGWQL
ncbi:MAG: alkaline phosphatase D family protein [Verrucomicrobiota bacterium]